MKRVISWLLAVALLLMLDMPVAMATDERTSGAFTYRIKGNGTAAITGYDWETMEGQDIYIPRMLDGYTVTEIADGAFGAVEYEFGFLRGRRNNSNRTAGTLVIPDTVISIGEKAFCNVKFQSKSLHIPASVQYIGYGAFANTWGLEQFTVDKANSVYATIDGILYNKVQKELIACPKHKFKNSVSSGVSLEEYISIPEGIKSIGDYGMAWVPFNGIVIKLPSTLERIGAFAFYNSNDLAFINGAFPTKLAELGAGAFAYAHFANIGIDLSNTSITSIPADAFFYVSGVERWFFPNKLVEIGDTAFYFTGGKFGPFPETLHTIGSKAFLYSTIGQEGTLSFPSSLRIVGDKAFFNPQFKNAVLPEGVEKVGQQAFSTADGFKCMLETLSLPASLRSIGDELCVRDKVVVFAPSGSYAAMWLSENGYITQLAGNEDTSWLND